MIHRDGLNMVNIPDLLPQLLVAAALGIEEPLQYVLPPGYSAWGIIPPPLIP